MSFDAAHTSADSAGRWHCPRCRVSADPDAGQCHNCGEPFASTGPRGRGGDAAQVRAGLRREEAMQPNGPGDGSIGAPPAARLFRYGALGMAGCLAAALVCYGLAWIPSSPTLQLLRISTGAIVLAGAVVALTLIVVTGWKLIYSIECALGRSAARREARIRAKKEAVAGEAYEKTYRKIGMPPPEYYNYESPRVPARRPSPWALSFSIIGIVCGSIALLFSMFPVLGYYTFLPLIPAGVFTIIALVLSFHERSRKLMPVIALMLTCLSVITMEIQRAYWNAKFDQWDMEAKIRERKQQEELDMAMDNLGHTFQKITNLVPTPPPPPKLSIPSVPVRRSTPNSSLYRSRSRPTPVPVSGRR